MFMIEALIKIMKRKLLFEYIYLYSERLREAYVSSTINAIFKKYYNGTDPHSIEKAGKSLNSYVDQFLYEDGSEMDKNTFAIKIYNNFIERGFNERQAIDMLFYLFKYAKNKFSLPETYQKIKYYSTTVKGNTCLKSIEIPRSKGLYIYLVDIIENYLKLKDIFLKSKLDKTLSEIMSQGEILNTVTDSKLISEIKNIEDKDPE